MPTVYSTSTLVAEHRFRYWQNLMWKNIVPAHGSTNNDDAFDAHFTICLLGTTTIFGMSAPTQAWERSQYHVRSAPHDEFLLTLMLSGSGCLYQDGHEVNQTPGVIVLYDTSRPYSYELSGETIGVKIPRRSLLSRLPEAVKLAAIPMSAETAIGRLAAGAVQAAANLDSQPTSHAGCLIGSSMLDLVAAR